MAKRKASGTKKRASKTSASPREKMVDETQHDAARSDSQPQAPMIDTVLNGTIVILTIVAIILGILIVKELGITIPGMKASDPANIGASDDGDRKTTVGLEMPEDVRELLTIPGDDASDSERFDYFAKVDALAEDTDTITLSDCVSSPVIINVHKGDTLTVKNADTLAATVQFDADHTLTVPGSSESSIALDFIKTDGIQSFYCAGRGTPAGILRLNP